MKWILFSARVLLVLQFAAAHADSLYLAVNNGSGDNFGYVGEFNGHQYFLSGGVNPYYFSNIGYAPGSTLGGETELFLYSTTLWVNGVPLDFSFPSPSALLFISTFTLPENADGITIPVSIGFSATGINPDTGQSITLSGSATGSIDFYLFDGRYYPSNFVQSPPAATVPEPSTLSLVGACLIAIVSATGLRFRGKSVR